MGLKLGAAYEQKKSQQTFQSFSPGKSKEISFCCLLKDFIILDEQYGHKLKKSANINVTRCGLLLNYS